MIASSQSARPDCAWKTAASLAMDRYAGGEEAAFSELYDLLASRLHAFLFRQTRCPARADDLLQQTFLQLHVSRQHFIGGAEVTPWAFAIARRLMIDSYRKGKREVLADRADDDDEDAPPSVEAMPDEWMIGKELAGRLQRELDRIPEPHRIAFGLIRQEGLSVAEAAQVLGITVNAVKLRAHRAYEALRAVLGDT